MSLKGVVSVVAFFLISFTTGKPYIGLSVADIGTRVVGGKNAIPGQFPYQVSLQWGLPPYLPPSHFCAGSIINRKWILTAGHCIKAIPAYGSVVIKAGKYNISATETTEQTTRIKKSFIHPSYPGGVAPYDIALILVEKPLVFNRNVSAIALPLSGAIPNGYAILSGWGSISKTNKPEMPKILQYANLPVISFSACKSAIESVAGKSPLHETNVCTGGLGLAACSGDSGGPLVLKTSTKTQLIGTVSWGIIPCGSYGAPSVYTRTSAHISWIQATIKQNS